MGPRLVVAPSDYPKVMLLQSKLQLRTAVDQGGDDSAHDTKGKYFTRGWTVTRIYIINVYNYLSEEVWKSNFRQNGQMKIRAGQRQREEKD